MKKDGFLSHIHQFRGLAIILIVGVHCRTSLYWPDDSFFNRLLTHGLDSSTILFVFISGFLFQHLNADSFDFKPYIQKKFLYVLVPYLLISVPAVVDKLFLEDTSRWNTFVYQESNLWLKGIFLLCTGKQTGPFYFMPMIAIIYLMAPLLFQFQKQSMFRWLAPVIALISMFTFAYGFYANLLESLLYFLPVYIFGMWASQNEAQIIHSPRYVFYLLVLFYFTILTLEVSHVIQPEQLRDFQPTTNYFTSTFNFSKLKEMSLAIILLIAFYRYIKPTKTLSLLGDYSFGIYFIHIYFINALERIFDYFHLSRQVGALGYVIFLLFVVLASMLSVQIVKKIFGSKSRLIIGC